MGAAQMGRALRELGQEASWGCERAWGSRTRFSAPQQQRLGCPADQRQLNWTGQCY